jgi:hypothetical protein
MRREKMTSSPTRRMVLVLMGAAPGLLLVRNVLGEPALPTIAVSKDPNCGCCNGWVEHLRQAGFRVTVTNTAELSTIKERLGVPDSLASCHTGEVGGYVVEGHVPADAIKRLLRETPQAIGLAVPGMPVGSPGMEGGTPEAYEVVLFGKEGRSTFGRYRETTAL